MIHMMQFLKNLQSTQYHIHLYAKTLEKSTNNLNFLSLIVGMCFLQSKLNALKYNEVSVQVIVCLTFELKFNRPVTFCFGY